MHRRAREIEYQQLKRRVTLIQGISVILCIAAVVLFAFFMPGFEQKITPEIVTEGMSASIFSNSSVLGFIVVAVLSFLLGTAVTVFCYRLKNWQESHRDGDVS